MNTSNEYILNRKLHEYGIPRIPTIYEIMEGKRQMSGKSENVKEGYTKAESGELMKFENDGDRIEGKFICIDPSTVYKDSWVVRVETPDGMRAVFVTKMANDLLAVNTIKEGDNIMLVYTGKKKTKDEKYSYNSYELFFKKKD